MTFDSPQSAVSIFAAGAGGTDTFRLDAFDAGGNLVSSDTETALAGTYALLSVSGTGITRVVITETTGFGVFVLDDLSFTPATSVVPEPTTFALFGLMAAGAGFCGWRRRKAAA